MKQCKDIQPEPIEDDEAEFISKSTIGQVIWCEKDYKGNSHHYDFKSYYCSILQRQQAKYPIKRGEILKQSHRKNLIVWNMLNLVYIKLK